MSRRFTVLALLLVALSGVVPAWACAAMAQQHDCCPDQTPCDSERTPQVVSEQAACCVTAPAPSQPVLASAQKDDASAIPGLDSPRGIAPHPFLQRTHWSRGPPFIGYVEPRSLGLDRHLYLQTGRLRL